MSFTYNAVFRIFTVKIQYVKHHDYIYITDNKMEDTSKVEVAIELLQGQIDKLQMKDFDLKGWKKHTILILGRMFGEMDPKISQIEKLDFEFNSWSLRDASGNESYEAGRKRIGRETLEAGIAELQLFGLPDKKKPEENVTIAADITSLIFDELRGSDVKRIHEAVESGGSDEEIGRRLRELLETLDEKSMRQILAGILMNEHVRQSLKKI
jgi:hypothetical protein